MKAYLFAYSQTCTQAQVHAFLNDTNAIKTWIAPFPYAAILVSELSTQDLGAILHRRLAGAWFIVTEMNRQLADGWMPGNLWEYVNEPEQASSRKLFEQLSPPPPASTPPPAPRKRRGLPVGKLSPSPPTSTKRRWLRSSIRD